MKGNKNPYKTKQTRVFKDACRLLFHAFTDIDEVRTKTMDCYGFPCIKTNYKNINEFAHGYADIYWRNEADALIIGFFNAWYGKGMAPKECSRTIALAIAYDLMEKHYSFIERNAIKIYKTWIYNQ